MRNTQLHPTFNAFFEQIKTKFESLDKQKQETLIRQLDHGQAVISTNEQLNAYLYRYGRIHQAKLNIAFEHIPNKLWSEGHISIVDYGCGQGIAEIVLCDFLHKKLINFDTISDLTLIDPSRISLKRCLYWAHHSYINAEISGVCKSANQLYTDDIRPQSDCVLHIFSNVIDIEEININHVGDLLNEDVSHNNVILCVSPFYQENSRGGRMDIFCNYLRNYHQVYKFQKHTDEWQHDFSCQIQILVSKYY